MPTLRSVVMLLAIGLPIVTFAQVYSWKDENGKVHYGSQPPTGKQAESRKLAAPPPADTAAGKPAEDEKQKKTQEAANPPKEDPAMKREREEGCRQAKANLAAIESGQVRFTVDAKGERIGLDGAVRDAEIARAKKSVESWCSPPKPVTVLTPAPATAPAPK